MSVARSTLVIMIKKLKQLLGFCV